MHSLIHAAGPPCQSPSSNPAFVLPAFFTHPPIPGAPDPPPDYDIHSFLSPLSVLLRHLARLFLLHDLSLLPRSTTSALFLPTKGGAPSALDAAIADCEPGTGAAAFPRTGVQARVWGTKALASPGGLSANEYCTLIWHFEGALGRVGEVDEGWSRRRRRWEGLRVAAGAARWLEP